MPTQLEPWPATGEPARRPASARSASAAPTPTWCSRRRRRRPRGGDGRRRRRVRCCRSRRAAGGAARRWRARLRDALAGSAEAPPLPRLCAHGRRAAHAITTIGSPSSAPTRRELAATLLACCRRRGGRGRPTSAAARRPPPQGGLRVPRPGLAVARHGPRAARRASRCSARPSSAATRPFAPHVDWSLLDELTADAGRRRGSTRSTSSSRRSSRSRWRSRRCGARWGVEPDAVVGHSMGEVAAAHVAGALTLDDAARVICRRSRLLRRTSGQGAMARGRAAARRGARAARRLRGPRCRSPSATARVDRALRRRRTRSTSVLDGARARRRVLPPRQGRRRLAQPADGRRCATTCWRSLAGISPGARRRCRCTRPSPASDRGRRRARTPTYWARNLREPVLFAARHRAARRRRHRRLPRGQPAPDPAAGRPAVPAARRQQRHWCCRSLRREEDERRVCWRRWPGLYARRPRLDWRGVYPRGRAPRARCRLYPWQRERYWIDESPGASTRRGGIRAIGVPVAG